MYICTNKEHSKEYEVQISWLGVGEGMHMGPSILF
jgi:hypothetical protein